MIRKRWIRITLFILTGGVFFAFGIFFIGIQGMSIYKKWILVQIDPRELYEVTQVHDGDTFKVKVKKKIITVRMLGINTPETVDPRKPAECYGKEASDEAKKLLIGSKVRLETNPKRELLDRYDRYLLYVYKDDGLFVNEYLIKNGFAREYTYGRPYSKQKEFREVEKGARRDKVGMWEGCEYQSPNRTNHYK